MRHDEQSVLEHAQELLPEVARKSRNRLRAALSFMP
jgi:hypothetical protein